MEGTREEWLVARKELLEREKELTRRSDELARQRRELPRVRIDKGYEFDTNEGTKTLAELFDGRSQLIVYHFMHGPNTPEGCAGCTFATDSFNGVGAHLDAHDVTFVLASRSPLETLNAYKRRMGWSIPWVSSGGTDFNRDFSAWTEEDRRNGTGWNFGTPSGAGIDVVHDVELMALSVSCSRTVSSTTRTPATTAAPMSSMPCGSCWTARRRDATRARPRTGPAGTTSTRTAAGPFNPPEPRSSRSRSPRSWCGPSQEATKAATFPTSSSVAARPSIVWLSIPSHDRLGPPRSRGASRAHPRCAGSRFGSRTGPSSAASWRRMHLDRLERHLRAAEVVVAQRVARTAEGEDHPRASCLIMWRAAARAVRQVVRMAAITGSSKSAGDISASGVPWRDGCAIRLKETSRLPASSATAWACRSTACSSNASTSAVSARPPAAWMSPATSSSLDRVRPARQHPRSLGRKGPRHRRADRPSPSVDHSVLAVLSNISTPPFVRQPPGFSRPAGRCARYSSPQTAGAPGPAGSRASLDPEIGPHTMSGMTPCRILSGGAVLALALALVLTRLGGSGERRTCGPPAGLQPSA